MQLLSLSRFGGLGWPCWADSGWPYSERWDSNPNSKPCPVTLVSPTVQTYQVGAGGSGLEVLPLALCQYVSIRVPPRNEEGTHLQSAFVAKFGLNNS